MGSNTGTHPHSNEWYCGFFDDKKIEKKLISMRQLLSKLSNLSFSQAFMHEWCDALLRISRWVLGLRN